VETNRHSDLRYAELILWIIAKKAALRYLHHDLGHQWFVFWPGRTRKLSGTTPRGQPSKSITRKADDISEY